MVFESIMRALSQGRNQARDRKNDTIFLALAASFRAPISMAGTGRDRCQQRR